MRSETERRRKCDAIVSIACGRDRRLFAAHESVLRQSPFLGAACGSPSEEVLTRHIDLPDEEPEIFACVLEFLYKDDYEPRLTFNPCRGAWALASAGHGSGGADGMKNIVHTCSTAQHHTNDYSVHASGSAGGGSGESKGEGLLAQDPAEAVIYLSDVGVVLKDTVIYCLADKYGLKLLKRLALRKQGLWSNISCDTIVASARYVYHHTPDSEVKLRKHYISLIIRHLNKFKCNGSIRAEMQTGGKFVLDLFEGMCNYIEDLS
jgi:hypothetical protein